MVALTEWREYEKVALGGASMSPADTPLLQQVGMTERFFIYLLVGGAVELDFDQNPTRECILIGTLDQVLSRQLMRAYSCNKTIELNHSFY